MIHFSLSTLQKTYGLAIGGPASSITAESYICKLMKKLQKKTLYPSKVWEQFAGDVYPIPKRTHFKKFFHQINNLHQNIKLPAEEESDGELAFLYT